jgi:hypothetical protein
MSPRCPVWSPAPAAFATPAAQNVIKPATTRDRAIFFNTKFSMIVSPVIPAKLPGKRSITLPDVSFRTLPYVKAHWDIRVKWNRKMPG